MNPEAQAFPVVSDGLPVTFTELFLDISSHGRFWKKGPQPVTPVTHWVVHPELPVDDLDALHLVGADEIERSGLSLLRPEGMTLPQEPAVQPGAPDEAVAKIQDLTCRLGDFNEKRPGQAVLSSASFPRVHTPSFHRPSQRRSDGFPMPLFAAPKEVS